MIDIAWSSSAFAILEVLPQQIAFAIVRRVDTLAAFPELGPALSIRSLALGNLRQLLVNRRYRVIYQYDEASAAIRVLAIQTCRQQLPTESELKRSLQKGFY